MFYFLTSVDFWSNNNNFKYIHMYKKNRMKGIKKTAAIRKIHLF